MDNSTPGMNEKLVQYLDGELTGTEKENLELQLATDKSLQNELNSLKSTAGAIQLYGLKSKVAGIHEQMMEEMQPGIRKINPSRKIVRYIMGAAASLLLLIGGYMAYNFFTLSPEKVFASSYHSYELVIVRNGNTNETPIQKAYLEKNYKEVLRIHDAGEDHTTRGEFLCGAAALEVKDNRKAIICFKEVLAANKQIQQPMLNDETEYYLSLSYIRNKNYESALDILNKIYDDPNHLYREKITSKLIRQVKKLKRR